MRRHWFPRGGRVAVALAAAALLVIRVSAQADETLGQIKAGGDIVSNVISIIKAVNTARSVVLEVDNNTDFTLRRVADHHSSGGFAPPPRIEIGPKAFDVFGSRSSGGSVGTGTVGDVTYTNGQGLKFTIKWANPFAGGNHCGAAVSGPQSNVYRVKATCGSGNDAAHMRYEAYRSDWMRQPGCAKDIGVDGSGIAWVIGCSAGSGPGNASIHRWNGTSWDPIGGGGVRIAVEPGGRPWLVNAEGKVYRRSGRRWGDPVDQEGWGNPLPGCAKDIGIDASGVPWIIGCGAGDGAGNSVHRWDGSRWDPISGAGWRIAVEPGGRPWLVNTEGKIYRRSGRRWGDPVDQEGWGNPLPGCAKDIGVDGQGRAWVVGCSQVESGFSIHRWLKDRQGWDLASGSAWTMAVEPGGRPWLTNGTREIYVRDKKDW